jgi:hypothetical protein
MNRKKETFGLAADIPDEQQNTLFTITVRLLKDFLLVINSLQSSLGPCSDTRAITK